MRYQPVRCLCMTHKQTLFGEGGEGGTNKALLYTLPRRVRDVEGRAVLSEH